HFVVEVSDPDGAASAQLDDNQIEPQSGVLAVEPVRLRPSPHFFVAVAVLGIAAVGLNAATQFLHVTFQKKPVPLAMELTAIPARLGPWEQASVDTPLAVDMEESLGTKRYIFRDYLDTRLIAPEIRTQLKEQSAEQRHAALARFHATCPQAVINL